MAGAEGDRCTLSQENMTARAFSNTTFDGRGAMATPDDLMPVLKAIRDSNDGPMQSMKTFADAVLKTMEDTAKLGGKKWYDMDRFKFIS